MFTSFATLAPMRSVVLVRVFLAAAAISTISCSAVTATLEPGDASHRLTVQRGQRVDIVLQTIGSGEYDTPPQIVPAILDFLGVAEDGPPNPGGLRQRFSFRASARGDATVTFTHTETNSRVQDTVTVR